MLSNRVNTSLTYDRSQGICTTIYYALEIKTLVQNRLGMVVTYDRAGIPPSVSTVSICSTAVRIQDNKGVHIQKELK